MKKAKKIIFITLGIIVVLVAVAAVYLYPSYKFFFSKEIKEIDPALTVVIGGGGNSGLLVTDSAVVVIDTKMGGDADDLHKMAVEKAKGKKIVVINTHYHGDHVKGNHLYPGSEIYIGRYEPAFLQAQVEAEDMPNRFVADSLVLNMGNETVMLYNMGQAHTFNDMVVYLANRNIIFTGDLVFYHVNPVLMTKSGANIHKWMTVLEILRVRWQNPIVVPGHGKVGGKEMFDDLLTYFTDMKTAASEPVKADAIKEKYKDWTQMPMMASPQMTIDFINKK
jgi:cyclase